MKIVYFGNNLFSSCLKYLIDEGHQMLRVYKNDSTHDSSIIDRLCDKNDIPRYENKPNLSELNQLISLGAEIGLNTNPWPVLLDHYNQYTSNITATWQGAYTFTLFNKVSRIFRRDYT